MEMTDEERRSILPPGIWLKAKCDNCGRPLGAKLFYRGVHGEYCSNSCLQEAADSPEFRTKRRTAMIKKMQNKASVPSADKAKKKTSKKTKEAKTAPAPKTEAKTAPAPKTEAKTAPAPKTEAKRHGVITNPFRPGSVVHTAFQRLLDHGPLPMAAIFDGLSTADPGRLLVDIRYRGEREGFALKRDNEGRYAVVPA